MRHRPEKLIAEAQARTVVRVMRPIPFRYINAMLNGKRAARATSRLTVGSLVMISRASPSLPHDVIVGVAP